jgi:hypothetical protein
MSDSSPLRAVVDSRLLNVGRHLRERDQPQLGLTSYSPADWKPGPAGVEMERLLAGVVKEENQALSELVALRDDVLAYCRSEGRGDGDLSIVDEFRAFRAANAIVHGGPEIKRSYVFVARADGDPGARNLIHDVRFFAEMENRRYQVLELVHDLLQFWEIFLRCHTTLDLKEFSADVRRGLLGRVTDTVFYQAVARHSPPVSNPAATSPSMMALEEEIKRRLEKVAFYLEERGIVRAALAKYTGRTFCDDSNDNAKRERTRILEVETKGMHELVHLADNVRKWLKKQGRAPELDVIERFRPFRIGSSLVNVLKHGIRGRNQDCAVVELETLLFSRNGSEPSPDDTLLDIAVTINYAGELFSLTQLIEDISQLWELFLRYHTRISITDFQVRLGRILLARKGLSTYSAPMPDGLRGWAQEQANQRKRLDLE